MQFYCISTALSDFSFNSKTKNCCTLLAQKKTKILFTFFPRPFYGNVCFCFRLNLRQAGNSIDLFLSKCKRQPTGMERSQNRKCEWNEPLSYGFMKLRYLAQFFANYNKIKLSAFPSLRLFSLFKYNLIIAALFVFYSIFKQFPLKRVPLENRC